MVRSLVLWWVGVAVHLMKKTDVNQILSAI